MVKLIGFVPTDNNDIKLYWMEMIIGVLTGIYPTFQHYRLALGFEVVGPLVG
jgi:hypothetical protein